VFGFKARQKTPSSIGTPEEIKKAVHTVLIVLFGMDEESIQPEARLMKLKGENNKELDSFDFISLIVGLEERFKIVIADEEAEKIITVGDLYQYLAGRRRELKI